MTDGSNSICSGPLSDRTIIDQILKPAQRNDTNQDGKLSAKDLETVFLIVKDKGKRYLVDTRSPAIARAYEDFFKTIVNSKPLPVPLPCLNVDDGIHDEQEFLTTDFSSNLKEQKALLHQFYKQQAAENADDPIPSLYLFIMASDGKSWAEADVRMEDLIKALKKNPQVLALQKGFESLFHSALFGYYDHVFKIGDIRDGQTYQEMTLEEETRIESQFQILASAIPELSQLSDDIQAVLDFKRGIRLLKAKEKEKAWEALKKSIALNPTKAEDVPHLVLEVTKPRPENHPSVLMDILQLTDNNEIRDDLLTAFVKAATQGKDPGQAALYEKELFTKTLRLVKISHVSLAPVLLKAIGFKMVEAEVPAFLQALIDIPLSRPDAHYALEKLIPYGIGRSTAVYGAAAKAAYILAKEKADKEPQISRLLMAAFTEPSRKHALYHFMKANFQEVDGTFLALLLEAFPDTDQPAVLESFMGVFLMRGFGKSSEESYVALTKAAMELAGSNPKTAERILKRATPFLTEKNTHVYLVSFAKVFKGRKSEAARFVKDISGDLPQEEGTSYFLDAAVAFVKANAAQEESKTVLDAFLVNVDARYFVERLRDSSSKKDFAGALRQLSDYEKYLEILVNLEILIEPGKRITAADKMVYFKRMRTDLDLHGEIHFLGGLAAFKLTPMEFSADSIRRLVALFRPAEGDKKIERERALENLSLAAEVAKFASELGQGSLGEGENLHFYQAAVHALKDEDAKSMAADAVEKAAAKADRESSLDHWLRWGLLAGFLGLTGTKTSPDFFFKRARQRILLSDGKDRNAWEAYLLARVTLCFWNLLQGAAVKRVAANLHGLESLLREVDPSQVGPAWLRFRKLALDTHIPEGDLASLARSFQETARVYFSKEELKDLEERQKSLDIRAGQKEIAEGIRSEIQKLSETMEASLTQLEATSRAVGKSQRSMSAEVAESFFKAFFEQHFKGSLGTFESFMKKVFDEAQQGDVKGFLESFQQGFLQILALLKSMEDQFPGLKDIVEGPLFQNTLTFLKGSEAVTLLEKNAEYFWAELRSQFLKDIKIFRDLDPSTLAGVLKTLSEKIRDKQPLLAGILIVLALHFDSEGSSQRLPEMVVALLRQLLLDKIDLSSLLPEPIQKRLGLVDQLITTIKNGDLSHPQTLADFSNNLGRLFWNPDRPLSENVVLPGGKTWKFLEASGKETLTSFLENLKTIGLIKDIKGEKAISEAQKNIQDLLETLKQAFDFSEIQKIIARDEVNTWVRLNAALEVTSERLKKLQAFPLLQKIDGLKEPLEQAASFVGLARFAIQPLLPDSPGQRHLLTMLARLRSVLSSKDLAGDQGQRLVEKLKALADKPMEAKPVQDLILWLQEIKLLGDVKDKSLSSLKKAAAEALGLADWKELETTLLLADSWKVLLTASETGKTASLLSRFSSFTRWLPLAEKLRTTEDLPVVIGEMEKFVKRLKEDTDKEKAILEWGKWLQSHGVIPSGVFNVDQVIKALGFNSLKEATESTSDNRWFKRIKALILLAHKAPTLWDSLKTPNLPSSLREAGQILQWADGFMVLVSSLLEGEKDALEAVALFTILLDPAASDEIEDALDTWRTLTDSATRKTVQKEIWKLLGHRLGIDLDALKEKGMAPLKAWAQSARPVTRYLRTLLRMIPDLKSLMTDAHDKLGEAVFLVEKFHDRAADSSEKFTRLSQEFWSHVQKIKTDPAETSIQTLAQWFIREGLMDEKTDLKGRDLKDRIAAAAGFKNWTLFKTWIDSLTAEAKTTWNRMTFMVPIFSGLIQIWKDLKQGMPVEKAWSQVDALTLLRSVSRLAESFLKADFSKPETIKQLGKYLVALGVITDETVQDAAKLEKSLLEFLGAEGKTSLKEAVLDFQENLRPFQAFLTLFDGIYRGSQSFIHSSQADDLKKMAAFFLKDGKVNLDFLTVTNIENPPDKNNLSEKIKELNSFLKIWGLSPITLDVESSKKAETAAPVLLRRLFDLADRMNLTESGAFIEAKKLWEKLQKKWSTTDYELLCQQLVIVFDPLKDFSTSFTTGAQTFLRLRNGEIHPDLIEISIAGSQILDAVMILGESSLGQELEDSLIGLQMGLKLVPSITVVKEMVGVLEEMSADLKGFILFLKSIDVTISTWGSLREELLHYKTLLLDHLSRLKTLLLRLKEQLSRLGMNTTEAEKYMETVAHTLDGVEKSFEQMEALVKRAERSFVDRMTAASVELDFQKLASQPNPDDFRFKARFDLEVGRIANKEGREIVSLSVPLRLQLGDGLFGGIESGLQGQIHLLNSIGNFFPPVNGVSRHVDLGIRASASLYAEEVDWDGNGRRDASAGFRPRLGGYLQIPFGGIANFRLGTGWLWNYEFQNTKRYEIDGWYLGIEIGK